MNDMCRNFWTILKRKGFDHLPDTFHRQICGLTCKESKIICFVAKTDVVRERRQNHKKGLKPWWQFLQQLTSWNFQNCFASKIYLVKTVSLQSKSVPVLRKITLFSFQNWTTIHSWKLIEAFFVSLRFKRNKNLNKNITNNFYLNRTMKLNNFPTEILCMRSLLSRNNYF